MCLRRFPTAISSTAPHGPLLYLILLLILLAAGCNSSNQPASPHIPTYTTIDILGASSSIVGAVDSRVSHSFLSAPDGTFTIFDPPGITGGSINLFINASGAIAGNFQDASSSHHGYLRNTDGSFVIIDDPSALTSGATDITGFNDLGQVVGTFLDAQGYVHGSIRN